MTTPKRRESVTDAQIVDHETWHEDKRFTVYKIEAECGSQKYVVYQRYSEIRELYEKLKAKYPKDKWKFPSKKFIGRFDRDFIQSRKKGLHEFIRKIMSNSKYAMDPITQDFFFGTPRHGRGHKKIKPSEETGGKGEGNEDDEDDGVEVSDPTFELKDKRNKKATVEDFEMLKIIGHGSFGKVLLSRHKETKKLFAVKVLNKAIILQHNEAKHVMSERQVLLETQSHPFLVGLHYSFQTKKKLYFVLDYVNGGELFFHLQREKRFSPLRAQFYAAEITSALGYLHEMDIIYRDLKPENILFDAEGHIKITDFGLCKEGVPPGEKTATFCGTPEYLAPEVLRRQPYGRGVDWWCLGCVTYEMLCGLPPFYNRDIKEMYDRILHAELQFPEHVPLVARSWLQAILNRSPDQRLGSSLHDYKDVQAHRFFRNIDFDALENKQIPPPWKPHLADELDLRNIHDDFTQEPVPSSITNNSNNSVEVLNVNVSTDFDGFSYNVNHDNALMPETSTTSSTNNTH
eukprot:m.78260 g.78260  ORF g.78260 m.78260 type:complete len:516 (-) comp11948_c0_seq2:1282-2829(-)